MCSALVRTNGVTEFITGQQEPLARLELFRWTTVSVFSPVKETTAGADDDPGDGRRAERLKGALMSSLPEVAEDS
jgi:hypothetical protein